jgi:diguanylate cyclase (GGDEF)-like protein
MASQGRESPLHAGAAFRDAATEAGFRAYELDGASRQLKIALPALGLLFAAFIIPDRIVLGLGQEFGIAIVGRAALLLACLAAVPFMSHEYPLVARERILGAVTLIGIAAFGVEVYAYRDANFNLQSMSVLLMICAVFLFPNRFWFSVLASLLLAFIGIASMEARHLPLRATETPAYIVDYLLMAALSSAIGHKTSRSRRLEYAYARELEHLARIDPLTGAGNRRAFEEKLSAALARIKRYGEEAAVIMLDLDRFKALNDKYGHERGDAVLVETVRRLTAALRSTDSLSRWGGEEFVVLAPRTEAGAVELAERLRTALASLPFEKAGTVTASLGVTLLGAGDGPDSAVARADRALYRAKAAGRNRIETEYGGPDDSQYRRNG